MGKDEVAETLVSIATLLELNGHEVRVAHEAATAVELAQSANRAIAKAGQVDATPALSVEYRKLMETCYRQAGELVKALNAGIVELR